MLVLSTRRRGRIGPFSPGGNSLTSNLPTTTTSGPPPPTGPAIGSSSGSKPDMTQTERIGWSAPDHEGDLMAADVPYTLGAHRVGDGVGAYLQPDGGWGRSNAGLIAS